MPLAEATAIGFTSPMITAILSAIFLHERTNVTKWMATLIAFGGVLLIMRPNVVELGWVALLPLGAAMSFISAISATQIRNLTTTQIRDLSTADIKLLSTAQIAALTSTQIAAIETRDMVLLTSKQIGAFDADSFSDGTITYDKLALIQASQVNGLTTAQIAKFNTSHLEAFGTEDIAKLTTLQLNSFQTDFILKSFKRG